MIAPRTFKATCNKANAFAWSNADLWRLMVSGIGQGSTCGAAERKFAYS